MAKNPPTGDGHRKGTVRDRSQFQTPSGNWAKQDKEDGRIQEERTYPRSADPPQSKG